MLSNHKLGDWLLIHRAEKYQCQLLIDTNPMDVYARFLWRGIRHIMYPDTLLFDIDIEVIVTGPRARE